MKEIELGRRVSAWLADQDFEIFPEVQVHSYGKIADIVARQGPLLIVVELKTSLTFRVVEQAARWVGRAHMVYIGVPTEGRSQMLRRVLAMLGIGVIVADEYKTRESSAPTFHRHIGQELKKALDNANPTFAEAGNPESRHWTPFQATCHAVREYVHQHPGATLKELVDNVETHYHSPATAKTCIVKWIRANKIPGLRLEKKLRSWTVLPSPP